MDIDFCLPFYLYLFSHASVLCIAICDGAHTDFRGDKVPRIASLSVWSNGVGVVKGLYLHTAILDKLLHTLFLHCLVLAYFTLLSISYEPDSNGPVDLFGYEFLSEICK